MAEIQIRETNRAKIDQSRSTIEEVRNFIDPFLFLFPNPTYPITIEKM